MPPRCWYAASDAVVKVLLHCHLGARARRQVLGNGAGQLVELALASSRPYSLSRSLSSTVTPLLQCPFCTAVYYGSWSVMISRGFICNKFGNQTGMCLRSALVGGLHCSDCRILQRHDKATQQSLTRLYVLSWASAQASKSRMRFFTARHGISIFWILEPCSGEVSWSLNHISIAARS